MSRPHQMREAIRAAILAGITPEQIRETMPHMRRYASNLRHKMRLEGLLPPVSKKPFNVRNALNVAPRNAQFPIGQFGREIAQLLQSQKGLEGCLKMAAAQGYTSLAEMAADLIADVYLKGQSK